MGDPIRASSAGIVRFVGVESGYGRRVEIARPELVRLASGGAYSSDLDIETSYSHLSEFAVREGARVEAGQVIGYCGNSGRYVKGRGGDGTHLHYEVRINGIAQDPENFYNGSMQGPCPGRTGESSAPGVDV